MTRHRLGLLVGALLLTGVVVFSDRIQSAFTGPLEAKKQRKARLEKEIQKRELEMTKSRKAVKQLAVWQKQSLPSDLQVARSLYQAWLLDLVGRVGLANHSVDAGEPRNRNGLVHPITFSVQGRGTLEQLSDFLYQFYRADHLHQIQSVVTAPVGRDDLLDLSISIEALVMTGADRKDQLSSGRADRLACASLEDYQVIAQRNIFGASGASDPTDYTFLTGIHYVNGEAEAWFNQRTETDPEKSLLRLREGAGLQIGQFHGNIVRIDGEDVVLDSEGERWLISVGESLAQASALPPER